MSVRAPGWELAFAKAKRAQSWVGLLALIGVGIAVAVAVRALLGAGFSHVSDDDFARTVIAEEWVASLRDLPFARTLTGVRQARWVRLLDPSGTSWLPLPFWVTGAAMTAAGRSIEVARAAQMVCLGLASLLFVRALRDLGVTRLTAACIVALGFANPYALWAAASQTPDAWVALLVAAGACAVSTRRADPWVAVGLLAATWSRYEAWPVAAMFVARFGFTGERRAVAWLPALGPLSWMAWNTFAHGSPLHFFARVASYRHAHEALPWLERASFVPRASYALLGGFGVIVTALAALAVLLHHEARRTYRATLLAVLALLAFLFVGSLGDGAPTHHPARAQLALSWIGATLVVLGARSALHHAHARAGSKVGAALVAVLCFAGVLWASELPERVADHPGRGDAERSPQIERGRALRGAASLELVPCRYEHLALIAAFAAPERVIVQPAETTERSCPVVVAPHGMR